MIMVEAATTSSRSFSARNASARRASMAIPPCMTASLDAHSCKVHVPLMTAADQHAQLSSKVMHGGRPA
jgi:hypothetical protein